ncbi:hypothetical protein BDR26DRAFT_921719 [Obelidium mucronatum]|nr:hypothetical protein BDR26DRAFT_921719 [Obelidium mucronatum]
MATTQRAPKMTKQALVIDVIGNVFFIALNASFLALFSPASALAADAGAGRVCEPNVRTYLAGQLALYCVYSLPQRPLQFYIENYNPELRRSRLVAIVWALWSLMTLFDILWFIIGQYWVFAAPLCKAYDPELYWVAVAQIIFFYVTTILPIFIYACLVCVARRRYLRAQLNGGTGPAAHLMGGLSKAELSTLRTFVFKTAMAVSPEEEEEENQKQREKDDEEKVLEEGGGGGGGTRMTAIVNTAEMKEEHSSILATSIANDPESRGSSTDSKGKSPVYIAPTDGSSATTTTNTKVTAPASSTTTKTPSIKPTASINTTAPPPAPAAPTASTTTPAVEADLPAGASTNCAICFCDFEPGDVIRELACLHIFHVDCIDPWLIIQDPSPDSKTSPGGGAGAGASGSTPSKAHRTCPLCVREAILPEFRDKDVELAMELQKREEAEMAKLLERLKKEAEEEQALIEKRKKREEEKRQRKLNGGGGGGGGGFGGFLNPGRGRSKTANPPAASKVAEEPGAGKRSSSAVPPAKVGVVIAASSGGETSDSETSGSVPPVAASAASAPAPAPAAATASAAATTTTSDEVSSSSSDMGKKSPKERLSTMKLKLQTIQSRLMDDNDPAHGSVAESIASAKAIEAIIDVVEREVAEEENGKLMAALEEHLETHAAAAAAAGDESTEDQD